ncbi:MAG: phosphohistidine phosphatase [Actinomycetota bacterium]|jgi:phosphohistidine phosphatase
MKTLYVLRHAKAVSDAGRDDIDRPLADGGRRDVVRLAEHLAAGDIRPDVVCCSPAVRTRQTLHELLSAIGSPQIVFEDVLYNASVSDLMSLVRAIPPGVGSAMLIGHNPGVADFVGTLTKTHVEFPAGALATLEVSIDDWSVMDAAELRGVVSPKDLP